jgi:hypothetical protein
MKPWQRNSLILLIGLSLVLSACGPGGGDTSTATPQVIVVTATMDAAAMQTLAVNTFAAGLTQTALALPTNTPTWTSTSTLTATPTHTLTPTRQYTYIAPTSTAIPGSCVPSGAPTCQTVDLTSFGGSCTIVCYDSCGGTTTSGC